MRRFERFIVLGGVVLAVGLGMSAHTPPPAGAGSQPASLRIATVDAFLIAEKMMEAQDLTATRDALIAEWTQKVGEIDAQIAKLRSTAQILPPNDPQLQQLSQEFQSLSQERETRQNQGGQEVQRLSAQQIVAAYAKIRETTDAVAAREGYSHVLANRAASNEIKSETVAAALQELLARPVIKGIPEDDITEAVAAELKVDLTAAPPATPGAPPEKP
jgi:Skp family chaperone for outer membrane proteins